MADKAGDRGRVWGWVEHLLAGGTSPWSEFEGGAAPASGPVPGAAQLEVARQLNLRSEPSDDLTTLVEHVLATSGPGRGQPDLALVGVGDDVDFGPPPVEPTELPADELLRITVGVLADLLARRAVVPEQPGRPLPRPWHRDYQLAGDPLLADAASQSLLRAGHVPGLRAPLSVLLGEDFATMLSDLWSWRILRGGTIRWGRWLDDWARQDAVPPRVDLVRIAAEHSSEAGRVHLAVRAAPDAVARLIGAPDTALTELPRPSAHAVELVRQTNLVLRVLAPAERRRQLVRDALLPLLADERGPQRVVPARHHEWVRRRAGRMHDELRAAGYPVLGDLDALVPGESLPGVRPASAGVLDVALRTLLRFKEKAL